MRLMTTISSRALMAPEGVDGGAPVPAPDAALLYPDAAKPVEPAAAVVVDPAAKVEEPAKVDAPAADPAAPKTALEGGEAPKEPTPELTLDSYAIKLPDTFAADDPLIGDFKALALDVKLPPEKAQAFADFYTNAVTKLHEANQTQFAETQRSWLATLDKDPDFTGERRTQSLTVLGTAMREYGSPEVAELLNTTGIGNNPHLAKYILKLATALTEGTALKGGGPANLPNGRGQARSPGEIMYPSMAPQTRN